MKHRLLFILFMMISFGMFAQIKIGDNSSTMGASSLLELESTDKALVLSRLADTSQITSPMIGMAIYDQADDCLKVYYGSAWSGCLMEESNAIRTGTVNAIDCSNITIGSPSIVVGITYENITVDIPYTGGAGGVYNGETVSSTGVTGLSLAVPGGGFFIGDNSIQYFLSGTPSSTGTASFALNIGGQTCTLQVSVIDDVILTNLTTSLSNYNSASDGDWVAITAAEYDNMATDLQNGTRVGLSEANMFTGTLGGFDDLVNTSGYSTNPSAANSYVFAFKIASTTQIVDGDDYVKLTTETDYTGYTNYGGSLPDGIIDGNEQHFVLKGVSTIQTDPVYLGLVTDNNLSLYQDGTGVTGVIHGADASDLSLPTSNYFNMQALSTTLKQW